MNTNARSVFFVFIFLSSIIAPSFKPDAPHTGVTSLTPPLFEGFFVDASSQWDINGSNSIARPNGFNYLEVIDYSDVGVIINNNSEESRTIGWAFVAARNISLDRVFLLNDTATPTKETINRDEFDEYFALPLLSMLQNRTTTATINYLVTTKGVPLRVSGNAAAASFDQEIALLGGTYNSSIGQNYWFNHNYGPLAGQAIERFTREEYGFFLVTRLTGYTVDTALELIERANQSLGQRGTFVLDLATNRNNSGYKFWNDDLYTANTTLSAAGLPVYFDEQTEFVTNISNVMGYASWGSNDGNWNINRLPNSGFDTADSTYDLGSRYWYSTPLEVGDLETFEWEFQTTTKQNGAGAIQGTFTPNCTGISGNQTSGLLAEFFDNSGVSINTTMPDLVGRVPNTVRIEQQLNWPARNSAYPGLTSRFNTDWSGRFTGVLEIPETGNWTIYIESDDGSEVWVDGSSLVQNHGTHGMTTRSNYRMLDEGPHDFRVEFFQGGGPHGLIVSWEGPNMSKTVIPSSAFQVSNHQPPQPSHLLHQWNFDEGIGSVAYDDVGNANLTLFNMNSSSWVSCPSGSCLAFDGIDDYAKIDVDDWSGNFTVSQFVYVTNDSQDNYSASFAVGDVGGAANSFQHMMQSSNWMLHNNQTSSFGEVSPLRWAHLATTYNAGTIHQYLNGHLVQTFSVNASEYNSVDVYKLGVNRAGTTYLEASIDRIRVWDAALSHDEVHTVSREILANCQPFTGAGQKTTSIFQSMNLPENHSGHAWIVYAYGLAEGAMGGDYTIQIEGLDSQGNILSVNRSSSKNFQPVWNSQTMRFRPDANAVRFNVSVEFNLGNDAQEGAFFIDTMNLRAIRPHMEWVNGSIAETAVSTGGRSFNWGTGYGQSLIADLLEDGVSGVKGYVYEPYLTAVGYPSVLLSSYSSGYNLAESHAAANLVSGWMGVVVGDPKMAAYADIFHDISILNATITGPVNFGKPGYIEVLLENSGMSSANGTLQLISMQGGQTWNLTNISMPAGNLPGSRTIVNLSFIPQTTGFANLRLRYVNITAERDFSKNMYDIFVLVNSPPQIDDGYCSAAMLARGGYTICTIEVTDDTNVTGGRLEWQIYSSELNDSNWTSIPFSKIHSERWEGTVIVARTAQLGSIALKATVWDEGMMSVSSIFENVTEVIDAPQSWFGPHASEIDDPNWNGASILVNKPPQGMFRHEPTTLTSCVIDADYQIDQPAPVFSATRGVISNATFSHLNGTDQYCYSVQFILELGSSLEDVTIEVRTSDGDFLLTRTFRVEDRAPEIMILTLNSNGEITDRVNADGQESLRIFISDVDDPQTSFVGDVTIQWPGHMPQVIPLDIPLNSTFIDVPLKDVDVQLEQGDLIVSIEGIGLHGSTATSSATIPFLMTPPEISFIQICDSKGPLSSMTFGQTATLTIGIASDRPIQSVTSTIQQLGWSVPAVSIIEPVWGQSIPPNGCEYDSSMEMITVYHFRMRLDPSFVDGNGSVSVRIADLDGLTRTEKMDFTFEHAQTVIESISAKGGDVNDDMTIELNVSDLDGLQSVTCSIVLADEQLHPLLQETIPAGIEGMLSTSLTWVYPVPASLANQTLQAHVSCLDEFMDTVYANTSIHIGPAPTCLDCEENSTIQTDSGDEGVSSTTTLLTVAMIGFGLILVVTFVFIAQHRKSHETSDWLELDNGQAITTEGSIEDLFDTPISPPHPSRWVIPPEAIPQGWTEQQFCQWLEGPTPEGWNDEQWITYTTGFLSPNDAAS